MDDIRTQELLQQQNRTLQALAKHFVPEEQERRDRRWRIYLTRLVAITGVLISGFFGGWEFIKYAQERYQIKQMAASYAEVANEIYYQENNADVAQQFLSKAIELQDNNVQFRYLQAYIDGMAAVRTLMNLDRPFTKDEMDLAHNAIAHAVLLERLSAKRAEPHILKAQVYAALNQSSHSHDGRALSEIQKAIALDPKNDFAHVRLACLLADEKKVPEALAEIDVALKINPDSKWAWLWKGVIHAEQQSDWQSARAAYAKALELDPRFDLAYYNQAWTYLNEEPRDYRQARTLFEKALTVNPNYKQAYYGLGMVYGYQDQYPIAKVYLDKAIAIDKTFLTALKWRGIVQYEMNNLFDALNDFTKAIELSPTDAELYVRRARVYEKAERIDNAIADLRFAAESDANDKRIWLYLGDVFLKVNEAKKALGYYEHALQIDASYSEALAQAAQAYVKLGDTQKARASLDKAVSTATNHPDSFLLKRGNLLESLAERDAALQDYRAARNAETDNIDAWIAEARLLRQLNRKQEALEAVNKAIDLRPQDKKLHTLRSEIETLG